MPDARAAVASLMGAIALGAAAGLLCVHERAPVLRLQLRGGGGLRASQDARDSQAPLARTEPRSKAANGAAPSETRAAACCLCPSSATCRKCTGSIVSGASVAWHSHTTTHVSRTDVCWSDAA